MRQPPAYTTWKITCHSPEEAEALQQWLSGRIALDRVVTDTVRVAPNGVEQVQAVQHRLGDFFAEIRVLPESQANSASFRLVFHRRPDAGRFWKDLMVNVLREIETTPQKAAIVLDSRGEMEAKSTPVFWTYPSVGLFSPSGDPVAGVVERANALVLDAIEQGWTGPPFDTFELANILGFTVIPCDSIRDARLVHLPNDRYQIEYNPGQSQARIRFSIAHEIVHTLFPDCTDRVRNRLARREMAGSDWQLEMLCNVGAAELLMPRGSFPEIGETEFSVDNLLRLRERFKVSTEAIFLRALKLSRVPCAVFAASKQGKESDRLGVDYRRSANKWDIPVRGGFAIPVESVANECRAIGFTAKGDETWAASIGQMHVECVAVASYPGAENPRVIGLLSPSAASPLTSPSIEYLAGDATEPRGDGEKIIAHVVNDATPRWGGGFARVVAKRWHEAQVDFIDWVEQNRSNLRLGQSRLFRVGAERSVFHMVAQHGFGPSSKPRIRYHHLEACLSALTTIAKTQTASVHMPRIGCGQAGGNWAVVAEMIDEILCRNGINVTIYDLPSERGRWEKSAHSPSLFDELD